jgi:hypothetical protein
VGFCSWRKTTHSGVWFPAPEASGNHRGFFRNLLPNGYSNGAEKGLSRTHPDRRISVMAHHGTATRAALLGSELAPIAAALRALRRRLRAAIMRRAASMLDPYRPELHYMRGPGPKWREKHRTAIRSRSER